MHSPIGKKVIAGLFVALFVASLAPEAQAQGVSNPSFTVTSVSLVQALQPDGPSQRITIDWKYNYGAVRGIESVGQVQPQATLVWNPPTCVGDNGGLVVTGPLSQTFSLAGTSPGAPQTEFSGKSLFDIAALRLAPGERPIRCSFTGKVNPILGTQVPESTPGTGEAVVTVKYLGLLNAEAPETILEGGPQTEIRYAITLTNLGNSLSNVRFEIPSPAVDGWITQQPVATNIESLQQGGSSNKATVQFIVSTPYSNGWNNAQNAFTLRITPYSTNDPTLAGAPIDVPVIARVRGIYVPGPEPMLMLAAVVGAVLMARMARRE